MKLLSELQDKILTQLKRRGPLSVDQVTSALGVAKTAARRNLLALEKRGLIEKKFLALGRGRPRLVFRLTPKSNRLFPSKEAEILSSLLEFLIEAGHETLVDKFFEKYWEKRFEAIQERLAKKGKSDFETRLEVLKEELEKEGFMPRSRVTKRGSELCLQQCHCPIEAAARINRNPCRLEKRLISRVLNAPVGDVRFRTESHGFCEFALPRSRANKK